MSDELPDELAGDLTVETSPIWLWDRALAPIRAVQSGHDRVDVLVVGAGLAGTAAAYYLAREQPGVSVMLVDAHHVGLGATSRSTGIVGPGLSAPMAGLRRRYGDDVAAAAFASTVQGPVEVGRLVESEGIACDARLEQHVVGALTVAQERRMRRHTDELGRLGFDVRWWDRGSVLDRLGPGYRSAFAYDDVLLVDPYRLVTGLAAAAERRGVRIHERTRVRRLETRTDVVLAHTSAGVVAAGRVLLATDGYSGVLNPHPSAVVPVRTHVVATAPLSAEQRAGLGWDGVGGVIDQRRFFSYYRLGAGGRLLFGGGPALLPSGDVRRDARASATVFARVESELRERFPGLVGVRVEARWSGDTGGTLDRLPVVGQAGPDPRVYFAGGWCGHGLALCVGAARHFASVTAGTAPAALPWHRSDTRGLPTSALRSVALPAYLRAMDCGDRLERVRESLRPAAPIPVASTAQRATTEGAR